MRKPTKKMRHNLNNMDVLWLPMPNGDRMVVTVPAGTPVQYGAYDAEARPIA